MFFLRWNLLKRGGIGKQLVVVAVLLCVVSLPLFAEVSPPYITAQSTATLITEAGPRHGWYLYEIDVEWNLGSQQGSGLSHWDVILKSGCAVADHLIEFDTPAGFSTSETLPLDPNAMGWTGYFGRTGDPSLDPGVTQPLVKFDEDFYPSGAEPGKEGYGTFYFYANIIPEYGTYGNAVVAKAGQIEDTYGELTGAYPSCTIIPEPAALSLLALGGLAMLMKRRRK